MADVFIYSLTDTWNAGGTTFTAIKMDVTNTASAAGSKLIDLQISGSTIFGVGPNLFTFSDPVQGTITASMGSGTLTWTGGIGTTSDNGFTSGNGWASFAGGSTGLTITQVAGGSGGIVLSPGTDNRVEIRRGTNAQTFRVYNTFTDASNYERGVFDWGTTSNVLTIGAQAAGTGTLRNVKLVGTDILVKGDTATPASGSTAARLIFGTTAGFGIYYGSGAPTVSAAQGSLYLRSDGSSTSTRLYVNTTGSTTWTNFTSAA